MHAHRHAGFGHSVELFQVDADGAVEIEQVRTDRLTAGVCDANARHAQHVLERPVYEDLAEPIQQPVLERYPGLAFEDSHPRALGDGHETVEHAALDPARVLDADHHLGQDALVHPRRPEVISRADLPQIGHHGVGGLGAVETQPRDVHLRVGIEKIADPGHGQVAQDFVLVDEAVEGHEHPCRLDHGSVRLGHAFGVTRRARRVENHRDIGRPALFELAGEEARTAPRELPAGRPEVLEAGELRLPVMAQPARVVEADVLQPRALRQDFQQLVDLLLVFDDGKADVGVLEHEGHFGRYGVLV